MVSGLSMSSFLDMSTIPEPVSVEEEETDHHVSESHLQLIKYRMETGYYDRKPARIVLAEAILNHIGWFGKATENKE